MAEQGAKERGLPECAQALVFEQLTASAMTFEEIAAEYGEEIAINVGIARDPDAPELDDEWVQHARPAIEVAPDLVERYLRTQSAKARCLCSAQLRLAALQAAPEWERPGGVSQVVRRGSAKTPIQRFDSARRLPARSSCIFLSARRDG